jgi:hypothetical protein
MTASKTLSAAITNHNEQKHPPNGPKRKSKWRILTIENWRFQIEEDGKEKRPEIRRRPLVHRA